MRFLELARRNFTTAFRDPISLGIAILLPAALLLVLQALGGEATPYLTPTLLTPGIVLFGLVMLMFSSAMVLSRDRETALLSRLLTTPLRSSDFVAAYSLPYLLVAVIQGLALFAIGGFLGLEIGGSAFLVFLVVFVMAICYIGLGIVFGSLLSVNQVAGAYTAILLLTIFAGTWFDLEEIGGVFQTVENAFPFIHALDAMRDVMADGAGFSAIATDLSWVVGYTVVIASLAVFTFSRRMKE